MRVLILTAGYGEGHNSAARGVAQALPAGVEARTVDVCAEAMPFLFRWSLKAYLLVTARVSWLWRSLYDLADSSDFSAQLPMGIGCIQRRLRAVMGEWQPDVIVSCFPLYPYLLDQFYCAGMRKIPYITVITDSLELSRTWYCSKSDFWAVTDDWTREKLLLKGLDPDKVVTTGFPVSLELKPAHLEWRVAEPFRILYLPQGWASDAAVHLEAMLAAHPDITVTVVLGRKVRVYYPAFKQLERRFPDRIKMLAWTRRVPQLLQTHHLMVGKAGGASVHECIAAQCPVLVNFFVAGQEEGNTQLLELLGAGSLCLHPLELRSEIQRLLSDQGAVWKGMKEALVHYDSQGGGRKIADLVQQLYNKHHESKNLSSDR